MRKSVLKLFLILAVFTSCVPTYIDSVSIKPDKNAVSPNHKYYFKNIFIVGAGSGRPSRGFFENLSCPLIDQIHYRGSNASFIYLRIITKDSILNVNNYKSTGYDSYLLIGPKDSATLNYLQEKYVFGFPSGGGSAASAGVYGNSYKEKFLIQLYNEKMSCYL